MSKQKRPRRNFFLYKLQIKTKFRNVFDTTTFPIARNAMNHWNLNLQAIVFVQQIDLCYANMRIVDSRFFVNRFMRICFLVLVGFEWRHDNKDLNNIYASHGRIIWWICSLIKMLVFKKKCCAASDGCVKVTKFTHLNGIIMCNFQMIRAKITSTQAGCESIQMKSIAPVMP